MENKNDTHLATVENQLGQLLKEKVNALPNDFNETRFIQNCLTVMSETNGIEKINPITIVQTLIKGAFLGLDFFNQDCYAIPYAGQLKFQTDYKGEIKLCKKYSKNKIREIYAKVVKVDDLFEEKVIEGKQTINFVPQPFNNKDIIGAFAIVNYEDGTMAYETMSKEDIEAVRKNYSKAQNSKAWVNSYGEMCKKTVLRRLCKLIDLDFGAEAQEAYNEGSDAEFKDNKRKVIDMGVVNPFSHNAAAQKEETTPVSPTSTEPQEVETEILTPEPLCEECDVAIDRLVQRYSERKYGRYLCRNCQQKQ
jgi:recombination protein RecT